MLKTFFPEVCPSCGHKLVIERGGKEETLKLMCKNKECEGSILKRLEKGIMALGIRGIGPSVIEDLMSAGITSSLDLFDPEKFNEDKLISSGFFVKGRALQKLIESVKNKKSIPIQNAILSLQLQDIGKTFSEKIGMKMSGLSVDFSSLQLNVREQLDINDSELNIELKKSIENFENFGVEIVRYKPKVNKQIEVKKVSKFVSIDDNQEIKNIVEKLGWKIVSVDDERCNMLIVESMNSVLCDMAKENAVKIMDINKIKLLFC